MKYTFLMSGEGMFEGVSQFPRLTGEQIDATYERYVQDLGLTEEDLAEGKSICVIGAASNAFAAGIKRAHSDGKHAFVMGVDPAERRYQSVDPAIINHDARALGFPPYIEPFDMVVSVHTIPKYFVMWDAPQAEKEHVINRGKDTFDYSVAEESHTTEEAIEATYQALSEMLRVTKPGGKVRLYPVSVARSGNVLAYDQLLITEAVRRLRKMYPKIDMFIGMDKEEDTDTPSFSPYVDAVVEIVRPRKKVSRLR